MKGQVAAETVAFAALARAGWQGNGDLVLCAVADEEVGIGVGASWIVEAHPELVRTDYVLNEGGGERIEHDGRVVYNVDVGEKMCSAFEITVHGRSAHASGRVHLRQRPAQDRAGDRADRAAWRGPTHDLPELAAFLAAIGAAGADATAPGQRRPATSNRALSEVLGPMLGAVITPTGLEASPRASVNVVPGRCVLRCDCRILPGQTQDADSRRRSRAALDGIEHDFALRRERRRHQLVRGHSAVRRDRGRSCRRSNPAPRPCPAISSGFTDSHFFRERLRQRRLRLHAQAHRPARDLAADPLRRRAGVQGRPGAGRPFFLHAARTIGELE